MFIPTISPSQLSTYELCPRKWAFDKMDGIRSPSSPAAALGGAVHSVLENWLRDGTFPPAGRPGLIAKSLIPHLPAPGVGKVELVYELKATEDLTYSGRIDLMYVAPDGVHVIHDHKTTGNLRWAKTPHELLTDFQAIQYAAASLEDTGAASARLEWGYVTTKGAIRAHIVTQDVTKDHVAREMQKQDALAAELIHFYKERPKALEVLANPAACNAFGGCHYRTAGLCDGSNNTKGKGEMGLADTLKARKKEQAEAPPPPPAAAVEAEAPPPAQAPKVNPPATTRRRGLNKPTTTTETKPDPETKAGIGLKDLRDAVALCVLSGLASQKDGPELESAGKFCYAVADSFLKARG